MDISSCFKVGFILKPHGLKGEVTLAIDAEAPADFETVQSVFLEREGRLIPYFIESISQKGAKAFVKFDEVNSIEEAASLSKASIYLPKAMRPKPEHDDFHLDEIIGFEVTDQEAGALGKVIEIMQAGPNKLLVIDYAGKEVLVPVNSPFITQITKSKRHIAVNLPDGFLDI